MANFTLRSGTSFPNGVTVTCYPRSNWSPFVTPSGAPIGSSADADTMTASGITFNGLTEGTEYVAAADVNGEWVYVNFKVVETPTTPDYVDDAELTTALGAYQPLDTDLTEIATQANVRGDILVTNSSAAWERKAIGSNHQVLRSDGTDPAWGTLVAADLPAATLYTDTAFPTFDNELSLPATLNSTTIVNTGSIQTDSIVAGRFGVLDNNIEPVDLTLVEGLTSQQNRTAVQTSCNGIFDSGSQPTPLGRYYLNTNTGEAVLVNTTNINGFSNMTRAQLGTAGVAITIGDYFAPIYLGNYAYQMISTGATAFGVNATNYQFPSGLVLPDPTVDPYASSVEIFLRDDAGFAGTYNITVTEPTTGFTATINENFGILHVMFNILAGQYHQVNSY